MSEEESTYEKEQKEYESILLELPELVKNRFDNHTVEGEYPVSYGKYHYDNEYQNRRIKFYKDYSQNPLTELKEKQRIITAQIDKKEQGIYRLAAESIRLANKYLSKSKANALKDEIILWLLAACREGEGYPGTGNGFCGLWDIDLSSLAIETESSLLQSKINQLNRHRAEWFRLTERQQIISDCHNKIALDEHNFKSYWNDMPLGNENTDSRPVGIKPHKHELFLFYGKLRDEGAKKAFTEMENLIEYLGLKSEDYYSTDTPENFDRAFTDWQKRMMEKDPNFLSKRSELHKIWKSISL